MPLPKRMEAHPARRRIPLKAKKYLALPIQSMLGCLKSSIIPLLLPFFRLQGVRVCSRHFHSEFRTAEPNDLSPTRLSTNKTWAMIVLVQPKCSARPDAPSSSGDIEKLSWTHRSL